MNNISQAFVLAAGRGERMKPLTDTTPKPLAKIHNKAMIDYALEKISALKSINKIVVNSYYLAEILEAHLHNLNNPKIIISHENEKLETGGGLVNAMALLDSDQPILIVNGDLFWQDENNSLLKTMVENFDEKKMDILLALKPKAEFFGYEGNGDFDLDVKTGELKKSANPSHTYIGVQIFHPRILKTKPSEKFFSLSYFFTKAQKENGILDKVFGIEVKETAFHIGTVKTLEAINSLKI
ncbi:MAG: nucleotidyltransferase family protein [Pseudomonadota bacterium]